MTRPDYAAEVRERLVDPSRVCAALGLLKGYRPGRQIGGLLIRCPAHGDRTPSCSVTRGPDGTLRVRCFGCDLAGDVFTLIAASRGLDVRQHFREVLAVGAGLASIEIDPSASTRTPGLPPPPRLTVSAPPSYAPPIEVAGLWNKCTPVTLDPEAAAFLAGRAIDPGIVELFDLARALPPGAAVPSWARCGRPWPASGHRLIVPTFDADGVLRSVRARRVTPGDGPKGVAPAGYSIAGLVMACATGRAMLERGANPPPDVVITEGEPDYLTWATAGGDAIERAPVVLGVVASAWTAAHAARIPDGARVVVRTHHDPAGDAYAATIFGTFRGRPLSLFRPRPPVNS